jgi:Protein of unknown function (DUF4231)
MENGGGMSVDTRDLAAAAPATAEADSPGKSRWKSGSQRRDEARVIRERILESLGSADDKDRDFIVYRYELPLIWFGDRAPRYKRLFARISLIVIAAGLLSSGLAALAKGQSDGFGGTVSWIVIVLGIVVGLGSGYMQISKPSQKSVAYANAQYELRREGWDLVHRRGKYKDVADDEVFGAFVDVILDLEARARAVDNPDASSSLD